MGEVPKQHSNMSQTARILRLFKKNGEITNRELNRICWRYAARIYELRKEGHRIVSIHDKGTLWRFVYLGEIEQQAMPL